MGGFEDLCLAATAYLIDNSKLFEVLASHHPLVERSHPLLEYIFSLARVTILKIIFGEKKLILDVFDFKRKSNFNFWPYPYFSDDSCRSKFYVGVIAGKFRIFEVKEVKVLGDEEAVEGLGSLPFFFEVLLLF